MERSILVQRKMRARGIVVGRVICQLMAKVPFAHHHDMVKALASDRSDQPFNMTVLPRRAWRDRPVSNAHGAQSACDRDTIGGVTVSTVSDEVAWRLAPRECFGDLSDDPLGGRTRRHIGPDEPSPLQSQDDQPVKKFASSEESVGDIRFRQFAKCMIQRDFRDVEGSEAVGFSHGQFGLVAEALDHTAG
jgi:hypothetical protein